MTMPWYDVAGLTVLLLLACAIATGWVVNAVGGAGVQVPNIGGVPGLVWTRVQTHPKTVATVLLVLVAIVAVLWRPGSVDPSLWAVTQWGGIPVALIVLGVAALVATLRFLEDIRLKFFAIAGASVVAVLVLELYRHDALVVGYRRDALTVLALVAALALWSVKEIWLARVFAFMVFGMLGLSYIYTWDELAAKVQGVSASQQQVATTTTAVCPGIPSTNTFGPGHYIVNGNFCQLRGVVLRGCVSWFDVSGRLLAHSCEGGIPSQPGGIYAMQPDSTAVARFNHCRPFAPGNLLDTCA